MVVPSREVEACDGPLEERLGSLRHSTIGHQIPLCDTSHKLLSLLYPRGQELVQRSHCSAPSADINHHEAPERQSGVRGLPLLARDIKMKATAA